jgi:glycine betaine catabolism B
VKNPPASEPEPAYEVKVDGNNILIKKQGNSKSSQLELRLLEKDKVEGTDVMSFKFSKQNDQSEDKTPLDHMAGHCLF